MIAPIIGQSEAIEQAIQNDPRTKDAAIDAAVVQGVVTLTGKAKTDEIRLAAEEVARQQSGVVTVINDIVVTQERY